MRLRERVGLRIERALRNGRAHVRHELDCNGDGRFAPSFKVAVAAARRGEARVVIVAHPETTPDHLANVVAALTPSTTQLVLRDAGVTDDTVHSVARVAGQLHMLSLIHNCLTRAGAAALCAALKPCSLLRELSLTKNPIADDGVRAVADALAADGALALSLMTLHLSGVGMTDVGFAALADAVATNNGSLANLFVSENAIGDVGAAAIAAALPRSRVRVVYAQGNRIGDAGAVAFAKAIDDSPYLRVLCLGDSLGGNAIGDQGALALAKSLHRARTFERLELDHNDVSVIGAAALKDAGKANVCVRRVTIDYNQRVPVHVWEQLESLWWGRRETAMELS